MLRAVDAEVLADAREILRPGVFPAGFQFVEFQLVGGVAVDLVGRHVDERRFRHVAPHAFQQVERAHGVHVEIVERPRGRQVVARLGRGVDDRIRPQFVDQP